MSLKLDMCVVSQEMLVGRYVCPEILHSNVCVSLLCFWKENVFFHVNSSLYHEWFFLGGMEKLCN